MVDIIEIREQILAAKEFRWEKQQNFVQMYDRTVISFKFNVPSWPKTSSEILKAFEKVLYSFENFFTKKKHLKITLLETNNTVLGPEAFFICDEAAAVVKKLTIVFEETNIIGRLLDIDVITTKGNTVDRATKRKCFLCDNIAILCMREGNHTIDELRHYFDKKISEYLGKK